MEKGKSEPLGDDLGLVLTLLRTVRGLTQKELADRAGIRSPSISDYESGKMIPGLRRLGELLLAMDFPLSMLEETQHFIVLARQGHRSKSRDALDEGAEFKAVAEELGKASTRFVETVLLLLQRSSCKSESPRETSAPSPDDERSRAALLWGDLSKRSPEEQAEVLADPASHTWALCELLCKESISAAGRDPRQAVALADSAVTISRKISEGEPFRSRLMGYALTHLANALRVSGDLVAAPRVMKEGEAVWMPAPGGAPDPLGDAVVYTLRASLKRTQGSFEEAISLHDQALRSSGADSLRVEILVSKAYTLDEQGDLTGVVAILEEASSYVTPETDPRVLRSIRHNLLDALSKAGSYQEAKALLPEAKLLVARGGRELDFVRLQWIEGRIEAGLGNFEEALPLLLRARGALMSDGIALDAALLTMEIAEVCLAQGRASTVRDLARNLATLFQAQSLPRETLAALNLFRRAAESETISSEFVGRLLQYLHRTRYNPELRFEEE
jgi:transcriptional regulator with XRE-family HTH domain/tetratricopeptide (TPR) repeat protein